VGVVATVARIVVGIVFVIAGASKLAAGPAWPRQARELGAPRFTVAPVPWIELAIGASLAAGAIRPIPALAAIVMLLAFSVLLVLRIREGRRPACACFGAWSERPIGPAHLARNAVLLVLAVVSLGA
jgi:uncharacterized membrane protein YphA (DoxX/SURF4 family)